MKIILRLLGVVLAALTAHGQTNKLESTGNAGIGTTTPGAKLEVVEDGGVLYTWLRSYSNTTWQAPRIGSYRYRGSRANPSAVASGDELFSFEVSGRNASGTETYAGGFGFYATGTVAGNNIPSYLAFYTSGGNSGTERMRITEAGNVGIGTGTPIHRLTVNGATFIGGSAEAAYPSGYFFSANVGLNRQLRFTQPTLTRFAIQASASDGSAMTDTAILIAPDGGNVGIGTGTPIHRLTVNGATFIGGSAEAANPSGYFFSANVGLNRQLRFTQPTLTRFAIQASASDGSAMTDTAILIAPDGGNVGIGTTNPTHKLAVNGTVKAKEVVVETTGWSDYVFAADYRLAPLSEVEQHIRQNGHLPEVPSATDVAARGVSVGEMQKILLQKIEELTLHVIRLEKENSALQRRVRIVESRH